MMNDSICLKEASKGRNNNLDIIRFFAALLVIVSHAYPISQGQGHEDFLAKFTNGSLGLGALAVSVFFVYGGFLICKSMFRLKTAKAYFISRSKRIFPPLMVVIFVLTFVLGPILSDLNFLEYFSNGETYQFLLNIFLIPIHNLPGVFVDNVYPCVVNGALWTLSVEFFCYIVCFIAYKLKILKTKSYKVILFGVFVFTIIITLLFPVSLFYLAILRAVIFFVIGMGMYLFQDKILLNKRIAIVLSLIVVLSKYIGLFDPCFIIFFPYIIFTLGFGTKKKYSSFAQKTEISYEIYLWGWPIQQIICYLCGGMMNPYINMVSAIVLSIGLGLFQGKMQKTINKFNTLKS